MVSFVWVATICAAQMQNLDVSKPAGDVALAAGGGGRSLPVHEAALQHVNLYKDKFKTGAVDRYAEHNLVLLTASGTPQSHHTHASLGSSHMCWAERWVNGPCGSCALASGCGAMISGMM